jgi:hypothetical protein
MMADRSELALVRNGKFILWSSADTAIELSPDPPQVGHPRRPLDPGDATCGVVTILGAEGHAAFSPISDDVQKCIVEALFSLKNPKW